MSHSQHKPTPSTISTKNQTRPNKKKPDQPPSPAAYLPSHPIPNTHPTKHLCNEAKLLTKRSPTQPRRNNPRREGAVSQKQNKAKQPPLHSIGDYFHRLRSPCLISEPRIIPAQYMSHPPERGSEQAETSVEKVLTLAPRYPGRTKS